MLINKLSSCEKEYIEKYISRYAFEGTSELSYRKPLDYILRFWNKEKEQLFTLLNSQMILSKEISFKKGSEELYDDMNSVLFGWGGSMDPKVREFVEAWRKLYGWGGPYYCHHGLQHLMYPENLVSNCYDEDAFTIEVPNGKKITINKGMKVVRAIGKIAAALDLPNYEEFRQAHSQVLNQKKTKGTLCLSIHPLDFMTMSDNDCGWDSCMNWRDGGDYRRGTVECMNSPMVVVAYLASEKEMDLFPYCGSDVKWNNKKWRQLFVITPEIITGIKGYPYCNDNLEKAVADWLKELAEKNLGWTYFDNMVQWDNYNSVTNEYFPMGLAVKAHADAMYNDCGSNQKAYFSEKTPMRYEFNYSGVSECLCCGEASYFSEAYSLICENCESSTHCEYCDDRIRDESYVVDGLELCRYCYEEHTTSCALCDELHLEENIKNLHLAKSPTEIYRYIYQPVCDYESCKENSIFAGVTFHEKYIRYYGDIKYVLMDDLTEEQVEWFEYGSKEDVLTEDNATYPAEH